MNTIPEDVLEQWSDESPITPEEAMGWVQTWGVVALVAFVFGAVMVASAI